jgi:hypothetical protein
LKLTLGRLPQGGAFSSAKPNMKKAKVMKTMATKAERFKSIPDPLERFA